MPLTQQQKDKYANDGFLVVNDVISPAQLAALRQRIHEMQNAPVDPVAAGRAEREAGGASLRKLNALVPLDAFFKELAGTARILDIVAELTEEARSVYLYADQVFLKPARCGSEKPLHQDNSYFEVQPMGRGVTCWLAIDDATVENGCMRYIPASHKLGLIPHRQIRDTTHLTPTDPGYLGKEVPVPIPAGAAIFHHLLTLHSSGANLSDKSRRAWALHYVNADATCPHMAREKMTLLRG